MLAGGLSLALGILGIFLPLLPTTPFVLLTAACWARASPRFHRWLLGHRTFGPIVIAWETRRALPRRAQRLGLLLMTASMWTSMWIVQQRPWLVLMLLLTWLVVGGWLWRLPETTAAPAQAGAAVGRDD